MGAFFLLRHECNTEAKSILERLEKSLVNQEFCPVRRIETKHWTLFVFNKIGIINDNIYFQDVKNFAFSVGTFIYRGRIGREALEVLFKDLSESPLDHGSIYGHYCLGVCRRGTLTIRIDGLGTYKAYCDSRRKIFSSSFLAMLEALEGARINPQAVYEYVFQGATYGDETVIRDIRLLPAGETIEISDIVRTEAGWSSMVREPSPAAFEEQLNRNLFNLRAYIRVVATLFGDNVDTALSGGYDSRLLLALLGEQRLRPRIHVYGSPGDRDVRIAKQIADAEGYSIQHIDKASFPKLSIDDFPDTVERNFYAFDGYPTDGIFDNASDLQTRRDRGAGGALMLNGGGGEVFRNFFNLPDRRFTVRQLSRSFYSRFDPRLCTRLFSQRRYLDRMTEKIEQVLGIEGVRLERQDIEYLYPAFRCRFWTGRNTTVNNRIGWALTPFTDTNIVRDAITIPVRFKNFGKFEASLIRAANPRLATYPSAYGHDFSGNPPLGRIMKDWATLIRPTFLRKYAYRLKRVRKSTYPYFLSPEYVSSTLDTTFPFMSEFLRVPELNDGERFNRVCTLEYLFQRYQPRLPPPD